MVRIGLIVNPVAGLGGRVGLKGTDDVVEEAISRGAEPRSPARTIEALRSLLPASKAEAGAIKWFAAGGHMGEAELHDAGFKHVEVVHQPASAQTSRSDTVAAARAMAERKVDLICFAGGDGTARDILGAVGRDTPMLGIPAGVKMHSGVFAESPKAAGEVLAHVIAGSAEFADAEILDVDEQAQRRGEWKIALAGIARVPREAELIACGKVAAVANEEDDLKGIAEHVRELMLAEPATLFVFGPGSTTEFVAKYCGLDKTLLGVDAYRGVSVVGLDLSSAALEKEAAGSREVALVVSPIGGQGFVIGRGNAPITAPLVARALSDRLHIVATPRKLLDLSGLRFDTGEPELDRRIAEAKYAHVITDYRTKKLVKVI